jgi:hypothetical protein
MDTSLMTTNTDDESSPIRDSHVTLDYTGCGIYETTIHRYGLLAGDGHGCSGSFLNWTYQDQADQSSTFNFVTRGDGMFAQEKENGTHR